MEGIGDGPRMARILRMARMDGEFEQKVTKDAEARCGLGDGERRASMTRQMPYEPLTPSAYFTLFWPMVCCALVILMQASSEG
jgi:hypothetical protein